jgi:ribosomal protein S18 acetylase RimI-like enzyme
MNYTFRYQLVQGDSEKIKEILVSTDFFYDYEIDTALELISANLENGDRISGYYFIFAEIDGIVAGYSNYGPTPCTKSSFDLYWLAVHKKMMNKGLGGILLELTEKAIKEMGGKNIWVETASREQYLPTRKFYEKNGYEAKAELPDFYSKGDNKIVYLKRT